MRKFVQILGLLALSLPALAGIPHFDLEMTSAEYRHLLKKNSQKSKLSDVEIEFAIRLGERLYQWVETINRTRSPENALRITSPQTRRKFPIDHPVISNPGTVSEATEKNLKNLPADIAGVLLSDVEYPTTLSVDDQTFAALTLPVEQNYRDAARYKMLIQWKDEYAAEAYRDVRGLYYLRTNKITERELENVDPKKLPEIENALVKICLNDRSETIASCTEKVKLASSGNSLPEIYHRYFPTAVKTWDRFFDIPANEVRSDIVWHGDYATVPFVMPEQEKFMRFLKDNIEDEFRWGNWGLKMIFGEFENAPKLIFVPGTTPHVPAGNNSIVMDSNQSLDEYDTQWVIRHEFGHILGLPDCYHEFYDESIASFVSYQLDVTDLMCSRAGNMNERIYLELKRVYDL